MEPGAIRAFESPHFTKKHWYWYHMLQKEDGAHGALVPGLRETQFPPQGHKAGLVRTSITHEIHLSDGRRAGERRMKGIRSVTQGAFVVILVNRVCNSFPLHLMGILLNKYPPIPLKSTQPCVFCGPSVDLLTATPTKSSLLPHTLLPGSTWKKKSH